MTSTTGRSVARRLAITAALALVATSLLASPTLAAKRASSGSTTSSSSSLTLVMVTDKNGNGAPNWGDTITWRVSTTATSTPYVEMYCYQGGVQVYYASAGYYTGYPWPNAQNMTLASGSWPSGAATCSAQMYYPDGRKTVFTGFVNYSIGA